MPTHVKGGEIIAHMAGADSDGASSVTPVVAETTPARAAGILFVRGSQVLLMRRTGHDFPGTWALPGGGMEAGESAEDTARRETLEETALDFTGELVPWTRRVLNGVDFSTFATPAADDFEPTLNDEHDAYMWVDRQFALAAAAVLHPGVIVALQRFDMDELGIAKAIRAGELSSPQRYRNLMLVALRITGTGVAYRTAHEEFVWRDPSLYLNSDFLERCQGLPVILEHPKASLLDTDEFKDRIVGTVMLPYIQGDEVWAVARILHMGAAQLIDDEQLSTSPGVLVGGSQTQTPLGGSDLLIEGKPFLLDHVAICPRGVWDKGGTPSGIDSITATDGADVKLDAVLGMLWDTALSDACRRLSQLG